MKKGLFDKVIITIAIIMVLIVAGLGAMYYVTEYRLNRISKGTVPTDEDLKALQEKGQVYEHVVIFGVDGAGGYFGEMDFPGFNSIFKNPDMPSSVTFKALSEFPTISAQNWGSMFHGVGVDKHKLTNDISESQKYTDTLYPSFMKVYAQNHPDKVASMYSIVHWEPINYGIIEDLEPQLVKISVTKQLEEEEKEKEKANVPEEDKKELTSEEVSGLVAKEAINVLKEADPTIMYMHFDCVDSAGHSKGYGKPEYEKAMKVVDGYIAEVYQACVEKGWKDNTLFICVSDHGHEHWGGHGSNNDTVKYITVAVAGNKGNIVQGEPGHVVMQDVASIVLYALGEKQPDSYESKVPFNMFTGLK